MLDPTIWKLDGTGRRVVRSGGPEGKIIDAFDLTFYRHCQTGQLRIRQERLRRRDYGPGRG